jgi:hypothetical protein
LHALLQWCARLNTATMALAWNYVVRLHTCSESNKRIDGSTVMSKRGCAGAYKDHLDSWSSTEVALPTERSDTAINAQGCTYVSRKEISMALFEARGHVDYFGT